MMAEVAATENASRANIALGVSVAAVVLWVVAMIVAQEENGWMWPLAGVVGAIGAVLGWTAGKPRTGKAMAAIVLGGLVFLAIVGWIIWAAATGNFD